MTSLDLWEELNKISDTPTEYDNDTDLDLETLLNMEWQHCGAETSKFSSTWADNYIEYYKMPSSQEQRPQARGGGFMYWFFKGAVKGNQSENGQYSR